MKKRGVGMGEYSGRNGGNGRSDTESDGLSRIGFGRHVCFKHRIDHP